MSEEKIKQLRENVKHFNDRFDPYFKQLIAKDLKSFLIKSNSVVEEKEFGDCVESLYKTCKYIHSQLMCNKVTKDFEVETIKLSLTEEEQKIWDKIEEDEDRQEDEWLSQWNSLTQIQQTQFE